MDDDPDQQADDLLALLVGESGVQARANLGKEVMGLLRDLIGL